MHLRFIHFLNALLVRQPLHTPVLQTTYRQVATFAVDSAAWQGVVDHLHTHHQSPITKQTTQGQEGQRCVVGTNKHKCRFAWENRFRLQQLGSMSAGKTTAIVCVCSEQHAGSWSWSSAAPNPVTMVCQGWHSDKVNEVSIGWFWSVCAEVPVGRVWLVI